MEAVGLQGGTHNGPSRYSARLESCSAETLSLIHCVRRSDAAKIGRIVDCYKPEVMADELLVDMRIGPQTHCDREEGLFNVPFSLLVTTSCGGSKGESSPRLLSAPSWVWIGVGCRHWYCGKLDKSDVFVMRIKQIVEMVVPLANFPRLSPGIAIKRRAPPIMSAMQLRCMLVIWIDVYFCRMVHLPGLDSEGATPIRLSSCG